MISSQHKVPSSQGSISAVGATALSLHSKGAMQLSQAQKGIALMRKKDTSSSPIPGMM